MSVEWTRLVLLAAEVTFAVLFLRALLAYLRRRDPLRRDVTLLFAPLMVAFCADMLRVANGGAQPRWLSAVSAAAVLSQPYLTLRLVGRLRSVPRALFPAALIGYAATLGPVVLLPRPLPGWALLAAVTYFSAFEIIAAMLILREARGRTGANRARLMTAAGATFIFGVVIMLRIGGNGVSLVLALVSAVGYLIAFQPPRWLRRLFSSTAARSVTERLLHAPADSPEQVWQTYAEIMRAQTGADAVAVLLHGDGGVLTRLAYAGPVLPASTDPIRAALTPLTRHDVPIRLRDAAPEIVAHFGAGLADDFVRMLPMRVPPDVEGAVLLFNRHRNLFSEDDLRLLADLGGHAGVLAQRQAITAELSASVAALTRAGQAKSDFLAAMSHELRTPLNAIIGFSDLMRLEEPDGDRRRVPAVWVDHVHSSGRHLLSLINDILDMVKVEAGRMELRTAPIRVDTAIDDLLTSLAPLFTGRQLSVRADLAPVTALADRLRFRQIVENLLSNAVKFTPVQGRITVTARAAGDRVQVVVADTGVGIAAADLDRVFEEFQQAGDPDRRHSGTGLGLALTRRLVDAHHGTITLTSEPGRGSEFTVELPAAAVVPATAGAGDGPYVLLIEDDPQSAELMRTQLGNAGYRVEVAGTGESGLALAREHRPDAVVLDVTLPGIDGYEVIRRLKADHRLAGIPVFFASILDEAPTGLALGAHDWFVKPVDQPTLVSALANAVAARPAPRVLLVDHDDAAREAISEGLRAGGADVVACADARDGVALSRSENFDLIVCDMHTPEEDGFSLLAEISADRQTPVLGLSAAALASGDTTPLIATAMVGGAVAEAISGGTEHLPSRWDLHPTAGRGLTGSLPGTPEAALTPSTARNPASGTPPAVSSPSRPASFPATGVPGASGPDPAVLTSSTEGGSGMHLSEPTEPGPPSPSAPSPTAGTGSPTAGSPTAASPTGSSPAGETGSASTPGPAGGDAVSAGVASHARGAEEAASAGAAGTSPASGSTRDDPARAPLTIRLRRAVPPPDRRNRP
ncbi:response regulator [Actinoplanes utahensis]|uniref:response regulator n=1 Tax=Actinoplanes utahensis TaxID=1869 RepID=UPI0007C7CBC0|nr:response regulator [Actinoplanes utahensis]GIF34238.1 hypothetical protein Aut01nite_72240 [Actinoplanes utahensis]